MKLSMSYLSFHIGNVPELECSRMYTSTIRGDHSFHELLTKVYFPFLGHRKESIVFCFALHRCNSSYSGSGGIMKYEFKAYYSNFPNASDRDIATSNFIHQISLNKTTTVFSLFYVVLSKCVAGS